MYCGKCGVANLERAKYCRDCGADMSYERDRGTIDKNFFITLSCIMLILIAVSLIYFTVRTNTTDQKLLTDISCLYNKM